MSQGKCMATSRATWLYPNYAASSEESDTFCVQRLGRHPKSRLKKLLRQAVDAPADKRRTEEEGNENHRKSKAEEESTQQEGREGRVTNRDTEEEDNTRNRKVARRGSLKNEISQTRGVSTRQRMWTRWTKKSCKRKQS